LSVAPAAFGLPLVSGTPTEVTRLLPSGGASGL